MNSSQLPDVRSVLIVKADRIYAEALRKLTQRILPAAAIRLERSIAGAQAALAIHPVELLITGIGVSLGGDPLEFLSACTGRRPLARHVLVVTTHQEFRLLAGLRTLPIRGAFDSLYERPERLRTAIDTVARGEFYWSRTLLDRIRVGSSIGSFQARMLTTCEQLVLSVLGAGSDNATAARELGMSPGTVSSVRRDLHRKLGVQHRGELMRVAAQNGFVQFTPSGVVRPGYSLLEAAHRARRQKGSLSAA